MGTVSFLVKKRVMEEFYFGFLAEQDETKEDGPIQPFEFLDFCRGVGNGYSDPNYRDSPKSTGFHFVVQKNT